MNPVNEISKVRKLNDNERDQIKKGAYIEHPLEKIRFKSILTLNSILK